MVLTASTMMELGKRAPDFNLPDVLSGKIISLKSFGGKKGLLIMFICRHCPYVQHIKNELARLGRDYSTQDVGIVAISSNDAANFPDDSPKSLKEFAIQEGFAFPLCHDETQETAKAYTAACTPDFFLFDKNHKLVYRGQLDGSRPESGRPVTGKDLRAALDAVLQNQPISADQKPSLGCNIKWKVGSEPSYFRPKG